MCHRLEQISSGRHDPAARLCLSIPPKRRDPARIIAGEFEGVG